MSGSEKDRRLFGRISSKIRCEFIERKKIETSTVNVSRNGVFVVEKSERAVNSLIRMKLYIPPENKAIEIFGRVAWKGTVASQEGYGIQFLKLDSTDRNKWIEFVSHIETLDAARTPSLEKPEKEKRAFNRSQASFMVRFRTTERLEHFVTHNLSEGGMFLNTPVLRAKGDRVQVVLVHPETDLDFEIEAEVMHVNTTDTEQGKKGMGLKFVVLSEETKSALQTFLKAKK